MPDSSPPIVLIHSPLVGPSSWHYVAGELGARGFRAITPALTDRSGSVDPYWKQHVDCILAALNQLDPDRAIVLVAHSGAGPLLPALRSLLQHVVIAYVFVDAGLPGAGQTRLELMRREDPDWADGLHARLMSGQRFPTWNDRDLRPFVPDDYRRSRLIAEIQPRSLPFFTEPIPGFPDWPDAPCIYIQFSAAYDLAADLARKAGWTVHKHAGGHFDMLSDPAAVSRLILDSIRHLLR